MDPPPTKKSRTNEEDGAYIPDNVCNGTTSLIFSLKEEKGALARALRPFEVCLERGGRESGREREREIDRE